MFNAHDDAPPAESGNELARYLSMARRRWWLLLAGPLIAGIAAYAVTTSITPIYEASATVLVNPATEPGVLVYNDILASERLTSTYRELITQRPVLESVIASGAVPGLTLEALESKLDVEIIRDTQLLRVSATDEDPGIAALIANAVAIEFVDEQQEPTVTRPGAVSLVELAKEPDSPISPNMTLNVALAVVIGLLLAAGLALGLEYLDDGIKTADDAVAASGLPTLGEVLLWPDGSKDHIVKEGEVGAGGKEAFGLLRTNVRFSTLGKPAQVVLITSSNAGEGKTTTAVHYAIAVAETGKTVALVDTDLRRPTIHSAFGLANDPGLTDTLLATTSLDNGVLHKTSHATLFVMPSGPPPPSPAELLDWQGFDDLLDRLRTKVEMIVLDSPPVLAVADARILAAKADVTLLVVDSTRTRTRAVKNALQALAATNATVLGVVLNKVSKSARSYGYDDYPHYHSAGQSTAADVLGTIRMQELKTLPRSGNREKPTGVAAVPTVKGAVAVVGRAMLPLRHQFEKLVEHDDQAKGVEIADGGEASTAVEGALEHDDQAEGIEIADGGEASTAVEGVLEPDDQAEDVGTVAAGEVDESPGQEPDQARQELKTLSPSDNGEKPADVEASTAVEGVERDDQAEDVETVVADEVGKSPRREPDHPLERDGVFLEILPEIHRLRAQLVQFKKLLIEDAAQSEPTAELEAAGAHDLEQPTSSAP